ncbi:hypothetical protein [Chryseobacterium sp. P1-3]|uniref:hypothetical protein n=1 Tax=Chryseobacterium sp. (strain P1-3) TaxID=1517683 RepID=UPI000AC95500|nr:hypothetical protein [Chryseobacterium sp. P1-3]
MQLITCTKKRLNEKNFFYFLIVFGLLTSCVSKKNQLIQQNILTLKDSYCKAPFKYNYSNRIPSYNSDSILEANKELKGMFSDQSILILNALDNLDEVHQIIELKKRFISGFTGESITTENQDK